MEVKDIISSGLLELYISGLTNPAETIEVEQWANIHPEVRNELNAIQTAMESYAQQHAVRPDPSVKDKIMARIMAKDSSVKEITSFDNAVKQPFIEHPQGIIRRMPAYYKYVMAASILLLVISSVIGYNYYNKYTDANGQLQVAQQKLNQEKQLGLIMHRELDTISNKYAHAVTLNGTPHSPEAIARIYWMKDKGGDVFVDPSNLPQVPSGMQYQLWAIIDGKPVDAGMISTDNGIYHIQKMKSFGNVQAFAITMEKAGGSPTPKGEMVVMSKI